MARNKIDGAEAIMLYSVLLKSQYIHQQNCFSEIFLLENSQAF